MNILFTGDPHVGKSTLLTKLVDGVESKQGFVTNEVTQDGNRTGFELVSALGDRALLANVESDSPIRVSRYGVNIGALETFLRRLPSIRPGSLLYVDEIGQMELFSTAFKLLVESYLDHPNPFIGTLSSVYEDDFTETLRERDDIEIVNLTFENRDLVRTEINDRITKITH